MRVKGTIKVKPVLTKHGTLCGSTEQYAGKILMVWDIAVDDSGYLAMAADGSGLGDIHKDDTEWFKPAPPDPMDQMMSFLKNMREGKFDDIPNH